MQSLLLCNYLLYLGNHGICSWDAVRKVHIVIEVDATKYAIIQCSLYSPRAVSQKFLNEPDPLHHACAEICLLHV